MILEHFRKLYVIDFEVERISQSKANRLTTLQKLTNN